MSLLQCTCTRSRTTESPVGVPYSRRQFSEIPNPMNKEESSSGSSEDNRIHSLMMSSETFEPDPNHYELYTVIGRGCGEAATISLTKHKPTGHHVAVKKTQLEHCDIDFSMLQNEVILCKQLRHEKIIPCLTTFVHQRELWTVMPLMAYGSCKDLLHAYFTNGLSEQASAYILRDTLLGLEYLHGKGIIHRGIRASHILIAANGCVCLSGLMNAYSMIQRDRKLQTVHEYPQHCERSLQWLSPEVLEQNLTGYNTKSDVYSLGVTACELANGFAPFTDMPVTQMLLEKVNGTKPVLADCTTIADLIGDDPSNQGQDSGIGSEAINNKEITDIANQRRFSNHFHNFVDICLEKDPAIRPSCTGLLSHSFCKHLKKKTYDILPSLLHPLSPLTDISKLPKAAEADLEAIADEVSSMIIDEDWNFES